MLEKAISVTAAQPDLESKTPPRSKLLSGAIWLAAGFAIAGVVALVLSHAPARLRLIGLLAAVQGAGCGWLVSAAGTRLKMRHSATATLGGLLFGSASVALTTVLWWQTHADQLTANYKPPKGAAMALAILNQTPDSTDAKTKTEMDKFRETLKARGAMPPDTSFPAYLEFRISAFSKNRTGGQVMLGVELLLAGILCAGFARVAAARPFCESCGEWIQPIRKHEFTGEAANEIAGLTGNEMTSCACASVVLSQCRCPGRRPDVLVLLESTDRRNSIRRSSTDAKSPLELTEEAFSELTARIDAAQGLR